MVAEIRIVPAWRYSLITSARGVVAQTVGTRFSVIDDRFRDLDAAVVHHSAGIK